MLLIYSHHKILFTGFLYQMLGTPRTRNRIQLSIVQGYMTNFYRSLPLPLMLIHHFKKNEFWLCWSILVPRKYGKWVARNPTLVLSLSMALVLLLCLGLIRFEVETRPEKVLFGSISILHHIWIVFFKFSALFGPQFWYSSLSILLQHAAFISIYMWFTVFWSMNFDMLWQDN